jgi:hypothetical protein
MSDRNSEIEAEVQWEIDRLRGEDYEICALVFTNREGDARLITSIDADEDVVALLRFLLHTFAAAEKVEDTAAH